MRWHGPVELARMSAAYSGFPHIDGLEGLRLVPGMPVEAFIRTGERTVLSYVMKPFTDQINRSFRSG